MAATSHDYWNAFLSAPVWKALHMGVYAAYGLAVMHVALGYMQSDRHVLIPIMFGGSFALVAGLHILAGRRENKFDAANPAMRDGWIVVGPPALIPDQRARIVAASAGTIEPKHGVLVV